MLTPSRAMLLKVVAVSGSAPDSSRFQRGANLSQLHSRGSQAWTRTKTTRLTDGHAALTLRGKVVPLRGIAPRSSAYRADALLLSYGGKMEIGCGGRIRTGDTRRMRPLPYRLATPRLFLEMDESENKHRCQSGDGLAPAG